MSIRASQIRYAAPAGWTCFAIVMVVLFLILTFPYDSLHATLVAALSERSGAEIRMERWEMLWPAGLAWRDLSVSVPGFHRVRAEQVQVEVKLSSLLRGRPEFEGAGRLGDGRDGPQGLINTQLSLAAWSWRGPAQLLGTIEQVDLGRLSVPIVKKGLLRARVEQRWKDLSEADKVWLGEGTWQVELTGLVLEQASIGPLVIPSLEVTSLSARIRCEAGTCRIDTLKGESPDGMVTGEGVLILHEPLLNSQLTLTLSLTLTEALKQRLNLTGLVPSTPGLPFRITLNGPVSKLQAAF